MSKTKCLIIMILLLMPCLAFAFDGEIWVGKYVNSDYPANPDYLSGAAYQAGVEIGHEIDFRHVSFRPYAEITTLMDGRDGALFHPAGVQYFLGATVERGPYFVDFEHMCWHPVDAAGEVYEYNLIRFGAKFGRQP